MTYDRFFQWKTSLTLPEDKESNEVNQNHHQYWKYGGEGGGGTVASQTRRRRTCMNNLEWFLADVSCIIREREEWGIKKFSMLTLTESRLLDGFLFRNDGHNIFVSSNYCQAYNFKTYSPLNKCTYTISNYTVYMILYIEIQRAHDETSTRQN